MKFFLHTSSKIRIINGDQEWTGTPEEFQQHEPAYPGLPILTNAPAVTRYQTPEWKYIEDAAGAKHPDNVDALQYCERIGSYRPVTPAIYVQVTLSKVLLCASNPSDYIQFAAAIRSGPDAADPVLPIDAVWPIMLRQKNGLAMDNILVTFNQGLYAGNYTYNATLPLGEWYVDEQDFAPVTSGDTTYQVKLSAPVRFTIYRNL
jgi:hypothetical protein